MKKLLFLLFIITLTVNAQPDYNIQYMNDGLFATMCDFDTDFDSNQVITTHVTDSLCGLFMVNEKVVGMYNCGGLHIGTINVQVSDSYFSVTKDTPAKVNYYFESDTLRVQNLYGNNLNFRFFLLKM